MPDEASGVASETHGAVTVLSFERPDKRNAVNDALIGALRQHFETLPKACRVVVLRGRGAHFCAGLDLAEHVDREAFEVAQHSRAWHATLDLIQYGGRPVVAAMQGAVIGGGLEIALATHVRVAEPTTFYQLPEGRRGIFVGGGASMRVPRVIGAGRAVEMMLTGRKYDAAEGQTLGLSHYLVGAGEAFDRAMALAATIAQNSAVSNYLILNVLPRIAEAPPESGLVTESLAAAIAQTSEDATEGLRAFLEKRDPKFGGG